MKSGRATRSSKAVCQKTTGSRTRSRTVSDGNIDNGTQPNNSSADSDNDTVKEIQQKMEQMQIELDSSRKIIDKLVEEVKFKEQVIKELQEEMDKAISTSLTSKKSSVQVCDQGTSTDPPHSVIIEPVVDSVCDVATSKQNKQIRHRLLIVGDSHVRGLLDHLPKSKFDCTVFLKPNANFKAVTANITDMVQDFTVNDFVVVVAGANDKYVSFPFKHLKKVIDNCFNTNVLICSVPYRYDYANLNRFIYELNVRLFDFVYEIRKFSNSVGVVDVNAVYDRFHYTEHGFHIRDKNKHLLIGAIMDSIAELSCKDYNISNLRYLEEVVDLCQMSTSETSSTVNDVYCQSANDDIDLLSESSFLDVWF